MLKFFGIWVLTTQFEFLVQSIYLVHNWYLKVCPSTSLWEYWNSSPHVLIQFVSVFVYHTIYIITQKVCCLIYFDDCLSKKKLKTNNHRESIFTSSTTICVDEFISRCCIIWGEWINDGMPIYVTIDCKPEGWLWDPRCCWCQVSNNDADETHEDWVVEEKSKIVCDNMNMD